MPPLRPFSAGSRPGWLEVLQERKATGDLVAYLVDAFELHGATLRREPVARQWAPISSGF
jgi:hypothetical protein